MQALTKGEQSREVILEAAKHLVAARGFVGTTVSDVLDAAQVTKGKFFHHFSSKEDLFGELLRRVLKDRPFLSFEEILREHSRASPFERLLVILDSLIERHRTGLPQGMRLCLFATFFFSPDSEEMQEVQQRLSANTTIVERLLKECQEKKALPASLNPRVLSLLFPSAAVGGNIVGFIKQNEQLSSENLVQLKLMFVELHKQMQGQT